jgi:hypothetical protein
VKVDSDGCSKLAYSEMLTLLNSIKIGYSDLTSSGSTTEVETKKEIVAPKTEISNKGKNLKEKESPTSKSGALANVSPIGDLTDATLEYNTGRKDFVLGRMLEDKEITADQYKNAVVGGLEFQFKKYSENIKAPHFVFYVKEYLENKYGKDFDTE